MRFPIARAHTYSSFVCTNQICLGRLNDKKSLLHKDNALSMACFF